MIIAIIIFLSLLFRLISINQSFWWDETISAIYAKSQTFHQFVFNYPLADFHPPGYFALIWIWGRIFGFSEMSLRMPSVIFGILTIFLVYLIGEKYQKKVGIIAAIFLSISPLGVYYSQEARMYSFAAFAVTFSIYCLLNLRDKLKSIFFYALACTLVLYSDYVAYFIIPVEIVYIFIYKRSLFYSLVKAWFITLILYIPWLVVLPNQLIQGQNTANQVSGWKMVVGGTGIKNILLLPLKIVVGKVTFYNKIIYYYFSIILSLPYLVSLLTLVKKIDKDQILFWFWVTIPVFLALIISYFIPVFSYFRFIFIIPGLCVLLAFAVCKLKSIYSNILLTCLILCEIIPTFIYLLNPTYQREDWKEAISYLNQNATENSMVLFEYNEIIAPYIYYNGKLDRAMPGLKQLPALTTDNIIDLDSKSKVERIYLVEYLEGISDPNNLLVMKIENIGFKNTQIVNFNGVGFIKLYSK